MHYDLRKHQQIKKMLLKYTKHNRNADKKKKIQKKTHNGSKENRKLVFLGEALP